MTDHTTRLLSWMPISIILLLLSSAPLFTDEEVALITYPIILAGTIYFIYRLAKHDFSYFASHFLFLYYYFALLAGTSLAEMGSYMPEIRETGKPNGATLITIFTALIFIITSRKFHATTYKHISRLRFKRYFSLKTESNVSIIIASLPLIFSGIHLYVYGSPLLLQVERSTFFASIGNSWGNLIYANILYTFPLSIALISFSPRKATRIIGYTLALAGLSSVTIVFGHKMSALVVLLSTILIFLSANKKRSDHPLTTAIKIIAVSIPILIYIQYTFLERDVLEFAVSRIAMQGQLLWSVLNDNELSLIFPNAFGCITECKHSNSLNDALAQRYLPWTLYSFYEETNTSLSGFHPATQIAAFGIIFFILIHFILSAIIGFLMAVTQTLIEIKSPIGVLLIFKIFFAFYYFYFVSISDGLTSIFTATCILLLLVNPFLKSKQPAI